MVEVIASDGHAEEGLAKAGVYLEMIKQSLAIVEGKGLFVREVSQKSKFKNPEDEILLWMKTDGAKEQVLEIMTSRKQIES